MNNINDKTVKCKICGCEKQHIVIHIKKEHNLTVAEYFKMFPGSKVVADAVNKKISKTKEKTKEYRSKQAKEAFKNGKRKIPITNGRGLGGKRIDINNEYFRSMWEANFARLLIYKNIKYQYEKKIDIFDEYGKFKYTYVVDFYLPEFDSYIEIKGKWDDISKEKTELFKKQYSNNIFVIIDKNAYYKLENRLKWIIPNWETPKGNNIKKTPEIYKNNINDKIKNKKLVECPICKMKYNKINIHLKWQTDIEHKDFLILQNKIAIDLFYNEEITKYTNFNDYNCIFNWRQILEIWHNNGLYKIKKRKK